MSYVDPETVISPKDSWELTKVITNTRQGGWSAAEGKWCGERRLGLRWNGADSEDGVGNPQSRGHPTWFLVPSELEYAIRREIEHLEQDIVSCIISRPDGYDFGAWRMEAKLGPKILDKLGNTDFPFSLPALPKRLCLPEKKYVRAVAGEMCGCFVKGEWLGDWYSNGISETENPTTMDAVRDAFIQNVTQAIQKARLIG